MRLGRVRTRGFRKEEMAALKLNPAGGRNPEELLRAGLSIQVSPTGWSMYPMFVPGRDWAVLEPIEPGYRVGRGDVILFRRRGGILVMHRVLSARPDGTFWFVGDNLPDIERGVGADQLIGILTGFTRKGREHRVDEWTYRAASAAWLLLRPLRPLGHQIMSLARRLLRREGLASRQARQ